jgi:site-specific recombinase XerD
VFEGHWRLEVTRRGLAPLATLLPEAAGIGDDLDGWLDQEDIPDGVPYLISPGFEYDVVLNRYFLRPTLVGAPGNTQLAVARDIRRFLDFLWRSRDRRGWRDATEADHDAYWYWRRRDPAGPRVAGSTWNRELSMLNGFYGWAVRRGMVAENPIVQRRRHPSPVRDGGSAGSAETTAAAQARDVRRDLVEWLTPEQYRRWRDVGLRGYDADGLPDAAFRGRWASRDALFADFMVRTGLRLTEQASLTVLEAPRHAGGQAYHRFWLPAAIAKGGSARWVYLPGRIAGKLGEYIAVDRVEVIERARAHGVYDRMTDALVIENPRAARPRVTARSQSGSAYEVPLEQLDPQERSRLLVHTPEGLEPAGLWLAEHGMPMSVSGWKQIFAAANRRCASKGVGIACHAHLLRHSFAVVTLEQLQRGHLADLASMSVEQRGRYQKIFGDPLDWIRRRLGHRSIESTMTYLHALQELEMRTRMALVPDEWDAPVPIDVDAADAAGEAEAGAVA